MRPRKRNCTGSPTQMRPRKRNCAGSPIQMKPRKRNLGLQTDILEK